MKTRLFGLAALLVAFQVNLARASSPGPLSLPRSAPEEQGVSSAKLQQYVEALDARADGMHSVMILRHGKVIAEGWWAPYRADLRHTMYSLSKSFAATAIGLAQAEGKLSVDDTVVSFFPEATPPDASGNLKAMRIRDLLAMSTGHHNEDIGKFDYTAEDAPARFLKIPVPHKPGTHFVYNTPASYMLSAIIHQKTGQSALDYLRPRLLEPLGIDNPRWDAGKSGISLGGFGMSIRTEDIAKFGQLYLQKGRWNGKQLLPESWVAAASARQTSNGSNPKSDWDQGYGYQFWRSRHGAYRGDGAFGQYCVVMPEQDAVLAITSGVRDMQRVLDITWDLLLPALQDSAVEKNPVAAGALKTKLAGLQVKPVGGGGAAPESLNGKKFVFEANDQKIEAVSIRRVEAGMELSAQINGRTYNLIGGPGAWREGLFAWSGLSPIESLGEMPATMSSGWEGNILTAKIAFIETPYVLTLRLDFANGELALDSEMNVSFNATKRPRLTGRAAL